MFSSSSFLIMPHFVAETLVGNISLYEAGFVSMEVKRAMTVHAASMTAAKAEAHSAWVGRVFPAVQ